MLENKCDWKISKADQNGNVYYYFPKDEDEFKEAVVKNGGMSVYVYQEGKFIDEFHTKSQGDKWTSSILNYLKTMSKDGEIFYRYYKNCKFFAIPKNTFSKDDFKIIKDNINNNISLNQILYGSPGTGKTYHTIDKALEILGENLESRDEKKAKFDEYVRKGQIVFATFHQSYGYEEFVEGIKPRIDSKEYSKEIEYEIKDGIFKELCEKALYKKRKIINNEDISIDKNSKVWKISLGANASLRDECFEKNKICIGWGDISKNKDERFGNLGVNDQNSILSFVDYMQIGDLVCVFNSLKTIKGVGIVISDVKYSNGKYQTYRDVKWILKDEIIDIYELNNNTNLTQKTVYELQRIKPNDLLEKINKLDDLEIIEDNTKKKFIIIIDEINRGNVSKIFGELL